MFRLWKKIILRSDDLIHILWEYKVMCLRNVSSTLPRRASTLILSFPLHLSTVFFSARRFLCFSSKIYEAALCTVPFWRTDTPSANANAVLHAKRYSHDLAQGMLPPFRVIRKVLMVSYNWARLFDNTNRCLLRSLLFSRHVYFVDEISFLSKVLYLYLTILLQFQT